MPDNARRWLPGAPGGWFPSPATVNETSESEGEASSRGPSPKRPCRLPSRASTELSVQSSQGSGPNISMDPSPVEEICISPQHVNAAAEASPYAGAANVASSANQGRSDEPCAIIRAQTGAAQNRTRQGGCARPQAHASTQTDRREPEASERHGAAGPAAPPQPPSVAPTASRRPVHRCRPRAVPCVELSSSEDEDEVRVVFEAPRIEDEMRIIPLNRLEFRRLCREYEENPRPEIGAQIRAMTTAHDARTRHREVVRRGRAERAEQRRLDRVEEQRRLAERANFAIQQDLVMMPGPHQVPPLAIPAMFEIPARDLAAAPEQQVNLQELVARLPPMQERPNIPQQVFYRAEQAAEAVIRERQMAPSAPMAQPSFDNADPATSRAISVSQHLQPLDLTNRAAPQVNPDAGVYRIQPAPPAAGGRPEEFRFLIRRLLGGPQPAVRPVRDEQPPEIRPAPEDAARGLQHPDEESDDDDAVWREIRRDEWPLRLTRLRYEPSSLSRPKATRLYIYIVQITSHAENANHGRAFAQVVGFHVQTREYIFMS
ncbi:hypothetical protein QAD02_019509 [Eretmocerus hayati]|uniref:Uncharacterized protein n=1 Tax=Eretmocerus hayati TaxID=131215 RepID=A0ACC2PJS3_9HYME|nr:hypothetical protein QAD02_019509 [Eretmocerus hayati]